MLDSRLRPAVDAGGRSGAARVVHWLLATAALLSACDADAGGTASPTPPVDRARGESGGQPATTAGGGRQDAGGDSGSGGSDRAPEGSEGSGGRELRDAAPVAYYRLDLVRVERGAGQLDAVQGVLRAEASDGSPLPVTAAEVAIDADRGVALGPVHTVGGTWTRTFAPDATGTGEYTLSAVVDGQAVAERTALVLTHVHPDWGQPERVPGLVNTVGWEDGANITADGSTLFVHYLPVASGCLLTDVVDADAPACRKAKGPTGAPERPQMPGAQRIADNGDIDHSCPSLGLPKVGVPLPPNTMYGFRRQPDGSFAEPFAIAFDNTDGCFSIFGLTTLRGADSARPTLVFAYDEPLDNDNGDSQGDLYAMPAVTLGAPISLGRYDNVAGQIQRTAFAAVRLGPAAGHMGNPAAFVGGDGQVYVFYDDETLAEASRVLHGMAFAPQTFPNAAPEGTFRLPAPLNQAGVGSIQPFSTGTRTYFRRDHALAYVDQVAADPAQATTWGPLQMLLQPDVAGLASATRDAIVSLGEPTAATVSGATEVYFVYVLMNADASLDFNVGRVRTR